MPTSDIIAAALHYERCADPYYKFSVDVEGRTKPMQGSGDSKFQATVDLRNAGLLVEHKTMTGPQQYVKTEGLDVYCTALKQVPLPKMTWSVR